jgi:regulator-associated protein of mTOR
MGAWAVDLALSVGIFPYVLKLLQTTATELRQILVFIWTKILALDKVRMGVIIQEDGQCQAKQGSRTLKTGPHWIL